MIQKQRQGAAVNALRMIPTKWAVIIVAVIIGYVVLQPQLNKWFGLKLPSVASLVGDEKPAAKNAEEKARAKPKETSPKKETVSPKDELNADDSTSKSARQSEPIQRSIENKTTTKSDTRATEKKVANENDAGKVHGFLTEIGRNRFESPAGLIYGPGSEEGHRLKHIERHLEDQPNRPGSHGVFDGDMKAFLMAIDDAYLRAKRGARGTKKTEEEGSIVYEASFEKAIGFLGGREGARRHNPAIKRLRVVVRGNSLITAFPFQ